FATDLSCDTYYSCFIRIPPSPCFTLFPYTTLFRSLPARDAVDRPTAHGCPRLVAPHLHPPEQRPCRDPRRFGPRRDRRDGARAEDRKSTRLNSSHVEISYAVFCLKKKKQSSMSYTR